MKDNKLSFKVRLELDELIYGCSYAQIIKPNFIVRIWRKLIGKNNAPLKLKRLDPMNIRLGKPNNI